MARMKKVKCSVRAINTCGQNKIMKKIEINLLMTLHESVTLPTLLYNAETWPLNATIRKEIDKIEIWAWKSMIGLPKTTPTAAVMLCTGALYASIRVQTKQLIYLHRVLSKQNSHWTKMTLLITREHNIGWAKQMNENLQDWGLETDWDQIKEKPVTVWKREVMDAAEKKIRERLLKDCYTKSRGEEKEKTKTKSLIPIVENNEFTRRPQPFMTKNNKLIARAYIMGRYGMLQCAANFSSGYGGKNCRECGVVDDEEHRINHCSLWSDINLSKCDVKADFGHILSDDDQESMKIVDIIVNMWDLENGRNCMRSGS